MPQIIAGNLDSVQGATTFIDVRGKTSTVIADNLAVTVTNAQMLAYQNAIGNMSNAAVIATSYHVDQTAAIAASTAYDEAESSVTTGANLIFQNSVTLVMRAFRVPAIDASLIDSSGDFLLPYGGADSGLIDAAVDAILVMLGGSWLYVKGSLSTRGRGAASGGAKPLTAEPTGTTPPPAPGV